jgi:chromate transporter
MEQAEAAITPDEPAIVPVSFTDLTLLFVRIGLTSFGGGLSAWLYREVVGRRHWMKDDDFLGALTMSQVLPGANVINLSIYVGHRLHGGLGAAAALSALLLPPMVVVILIAMLFERVGDLPWLHNSLEGIAAAAMGMTIAMGLRSGRRALANGRWSLFIIVAIFAAIGVLRWPLVPVVLVLTFVSLLFARARP